MVRVAIALLLLMAWPATAGAQAEKRVALVIGNSAYQHTPKLTNPKNDATDMVAALKKHGFQVLEGFDLDKAAFDRKVRDFANALQGAEAGVFFFAGHGLQVSGHNYLVPIDAQLTTVAALEFEMVRLDVVHRVMERLANTNVLFLDACRDNPLARNLARAMGTRSAEIGRGLAAVESGVGTLISFSTQPGNVALDGAGRNSPFAGALVKHMSASNDDLSAVLIATRNDVMKETQRKQVPWEHSALTGRFYFGSQPKVASPAPVAPARVSDAAEAWDRTKDTTSIVMLEAFIRRFGDTYYGDLAKVRLADLKQAETEARIKAEAARQRVALLQREEEKRAEAAKAEAERERVALLKKEEERKRTEAEADARSKAEAERQRLALLHKEEERKRAEAAANATRPAPTAARDPEELIRAVQKELKRVGCYSGEIDGRWGAGGKEALRQFTRLAKIDLQTDEASEATLAAIMTRKDRVCACGPTQVENNGKCVPKTRNEPAKPKVVDQPAKQPANEDKGSSQGTKMCWNNLTAGGVVPCSDSRARSN